MSYSTDILDMDILDYVESNDTLFMGLNQYAPGGPGKEMLGLMNREMKLASN